MYVDKYISYVDVTKIFDTVVRGVRILEKLWNAGVRGVSYN